MHPHVLAILLSLATTAVAGLALWACTAALLRRRRQARTAPMALKVAAAGAGLAALGAGYLALAFLGMTVNGGSRERTTLSTNGQMRLIERRDMWGRSGMCLYWNEAGVLDRDRSGCYSGGRRVARIAVEAEGVGFRDDRGRCGPWMYFGPDGETDWARSGRYERDERMLMRLEDPLASVQVAYTALPLDPPELDDLRLAWASR